MKRSLTSLLMAAALAWLAPNVAAQVVATTHYGSTTYASPGPWGARGYAGGYVSSRVWVPGGFDIVHQQVWVPEQCTTYSRGQGGWRHNGWRHGGRTVCRPGYYDQRWVPGYYQTVMQWVWVPYRGGRFHIMVSGAGGTVFGG